MDIFLNMNFDFTLSQFSNFRNLFKNVDVVKHLMWLKIQIYNVDLYNADYVNTACVS